VTESPTHRGLIAWFASNHVAANLLMFGIIALGVMSAFTIRKQSLPDFEINTVQIVVPYLGAAPQEVEEGVVIKIEEAVQDIDEVEDIRSMSTEGVGRVYLDVRDVEDLEYVLNEAKARVDAIATFPAQTERPVITKREPINQVMIIALYGDIDEYSRKMLVHQLGDELVELDAVTEVGYFGDRDFEISIEVSEFDLQRYGLTMSDVSQAIRNSSVDLPGGTINTAGGDILLRTKGQAYDGIDFAQIVLRTFADGTRLTLADIATIDDGFVEDKFLARFNGQPASSIRILTSSRINELETSTAVAEFVERKSAALPEGVKLQVWADRTPYLIDRLDLMLKNMLFGAILVFLMLALFLRAMVAFWVIIGIPLTFLGALWLMPHMPYPVSVNLLSLFGFIMVLGIVVDDAIIIGESIYTQIRADGHSLDSVVKGAHRVAVPATFGVLTTVAAFLPLMFIEGFTKAFFVSMSAVVILCLLFSLVESKLILPAHLAAFPLAAVDEDDLFRRKPGISPSEAIGRFFLRINRRTQHGLHYVIDNLYRPSLAKAIRNRGITVAAFFSVLLASVGLIAGGHVRLVVFPEVAGEIVQVNMSMRDGTSREDRDAAILHVENVLAEQAAAYDAEHPGELPYVRTRAVFGTGATSALLFTELPRNADRDFDANDVIARWRDGVGEVPGLKEINFSFGFQLGGGAPISFELNGNNIEALENAARELERRLTEYDGVFDIVNSSASGSQEIKLAIRPEAESLGLTLSSLGRQVRQAFFGEEAQRLQRGKDELRVMVRYPDAERRSVEDLESMFIRTPDGTEVPFNTVADIDFGSGYSSISRVNRSRTVTVSADADLSRVEPQTVVADVRQNVLPGILERNPGVRFGLAGGAEEQGEFLTNVAIAFLGALMLIYILIAIPLKSYAQPLIIMSVIPFGAIGAIVGHLLLGKAISMFSIFGLVALAGVVVNDSLIMVDFINKARLAGRPLMDAVVESGAQRFRAIILTSVTTAAGLMPIIVETSAQAQFLIPMAISVSFGILFATVITLYLVPCLYLMQVGFMSGLRKGWNIAWGPREARSASESA